MIRTLPKLFKFKTLRDWANGLTLFRAFAGIPLVISLSIGNIELAWICLFLAAISDFLDGRLARQAGGSTNWGAHFDPLFDKILLAGPLIWLSSTAFLPVWAVWLLISRELLISGWRASNKEESSASLGGKLKTNLQFLSLLLLLWPPGWGGIFISQTLNDLGWWIFWPSLIIAMTSALSYLKGQSNLHQN